MAGEGEYDENNVDDGGMTGPGAPTPLSALEVSFILPKSRPRNYADRKSRALQA